MNASLEYISIGGNCHPSAADWHHGQNLLAYGAGSSIAFWHPQAPSQKGIHQLLRAHRDTVQAVRFVCDQRGNLYLVSGGADKSLALWTITTQTPASPSGGTLLKYYPDCHGASINCLTSPLQVPGLLASGGADGAVNIWMLSDTDGKTELQCAQKLSLSPALLPLALSMIQLDDKSTILAVGGTRNTVQIFASTDLQDFVLQATLTGHDGWVRSLDFVREGDERQGDTLLASASQDKYIRLWRFHRGVEPSSLRLTLNPSLTNKIHKVKAGGTVYTVMFEALLVGHEDWIYSAQWFTSHNGLQLLSTSADNSIAVWESDPTEGVWYVVHRFGDISAQKGSTTATGSMGGLWNGLWGPKGSTLVALAKTGGWRRWNFEPGPQIWHQTSGVGGHVKSVRGLTWSPDGSYFLTTSADQTTRLHSQLQRNGSAYWHEFSRPQIHGYDLNCICAINETTFVSGADEKLLRVFEEPDDVAALLQDLCHIEAPEPRDIRAADIPVLGLSNKAAATDHGEDDTDNHSTPPGLLGSVSHGGGDGQLPLEDYLSKSSLWPEKEKLYGHGFEVNSVAASHGGQLIATSCRASSIDHAVIRLFDTRTWQQILPPLQAHTLTVTDLEFSPDDAMLLSVGRDRQWAIWERSHGAGNMYKLKAADAKAHSRMILCAAWISGAPNPLFATGGRDKCVKLWTASEETFSAAGTYGTPAPVLTVAATWDGLTQFSLLALGLENGGVHILRLDPSTTEVIGKPIVLESRICPSLAVNQLLWKPRRTETEEPQKTSPSNSLAIASEDHSIRLIDLLSHSSQAKNLIEAQHIDSKTEIPT